MCFKLMNLRLVVIFVTTVGEENLEQLHGFLTSISELMSPGLVDAIDETVGMKKKNKD